MFYHIILVVVYLPPKGTLNSESLWQKQRKKLLSVTIRSSVDARARAHTRPPTPHPLTLRMQKSLSW